MSVIKIKAALIQAVTELSGVTADNTDYPNTLFQPAANAPFWHRVNFSPSQPTPATCGVDGEDELTGFLQIDCYCPLGKGEKPATDRVALFLEKFKTGSKFAYGGQEVMVTSAGRSAGFVAQNWYQVPITIFFLARYQRNTPT